MRSNYSFLFLFSIAFSQTNFSSKKVISDASNGAQDVYAIDLDQDGDMDVLAASFSDNRITFWENTGSTFENRTITTSANGAYGVFAIDVDSDGDIDVLSASATDDKIAWYENNGSESFTARTITTSADNARSVFAIDVDSDGDIDVLSASWSDDKIAWYENNGSESFTARTITTSADAALSVFAIDVDNDGDIDVLSASHFDDKIAWYENNGSESFTARTITTSADNARSVFAIDVDSDGDIDVLSASEADGKIAWYENNGSENFTEYTITNSAGAQDVFATDIDFDGDIDVLSGSSGDDLIAWYENNGSQSFTARTISTNADAHSVFASDIDSDGDIDVLSALYNNSEIDWFENTTTHPGSPNSFVPNTINTNELTYRSVYAEDIDLDGDMDILSASQDDDKIAWYENNGSESFTARTISTDCSEAYSVYAEDIDQDGDLDVLSACISSDKIAWYENNGSESFTARTITTSANGANFVYSIDLDRDGDMDVLSSSQFDDKIAWYENNGSESFTARTITTSADGAYSVYAIDIDNDGDIDVLSASGSDDKIAWYENNGSESFTARTITTSADGAKSVFAKDLDRDGDIDILSASYSDGKISWYENDGAANPSFTSNNIGQSGSPYSVYATDFDKDGDVDIISGSSSNVTWWKNDGNSDPGFSIGKMFAMGKSTHSVYATDVDSDGDMDILSAENNGKLFWHSVSIDNASPLISSVSISSDNANAVVTFNESVYNTAGGAGSLEKSDFSFSLSGGLATLTNSNPTSISVSGNVYTLGIGLNGTPTGSETITVTPVTNSIYDNAGNVASTTQSNNSVALNDKKSMFTVKKDDSGDVTTIQAAINAASSGDTIIVHAGTYIENIDYDGKNVVLGSLYMTTNDTSHISSTIIDGGNSKTTVLFNSGENNSAVLNGFTIQNGKATNSSSDDSRIGNYQSGGGITIFGSAPIIKNCTIKNNHGSTSSGGGIEVSKGSNGSWPTTNTPIIENCIISHNAGNGIRMNDNGIGDNQAKVYIKNSIVARNSWHGILSEYYSIFEILNCTIEAQGATGLYTTYGIDNKQIVKNTIIWNNGLEMSGNIYAPKVISTNNVVDGISSWNGNPVINSNPYFVNAAINDYRLLSYSPAIGAGTTSGAPSTDIEGKTRPTPSGTNPDIGAYENDLGTRTVEVLSVTSDVINGTYIIGDIIPISVNFTESVTVTGTPQLTFETGSSDFVSDYSSGSGSSSLTFNYTIASGNIANDLDYISSSALSLNGGSIKNSAGTAANLTLPTPGSTGSLGSNKDIGIDGVIPTILGVSSSNANGVSKVNDEVKIAIGFSEVVIVTGEPRLKLETGSTDQYASYASGTGNDTLFFSYAVAANDTSSDLDYASSNALELNGGSIRDVATFTVGNNANLTLPTPGSTGSLGTNKALVIDGNVPSVISVSSSKSDGIYQTVGETIPITVTFSQSVNVTGTPQLTLETGTLDAVIDYSSGTSTSTLTFNYVVAEGHITSNLDYTSSSSLVLNGGTIKDASGNIASLALAITGETNSLGANKAIIVDTVIPNYTITPANGSTDNSINSNIIFTFNKSVRNIDNSEITGSNVKQLIVLKNTDANGDDIAFDVSVNDSKTAITIDPISDFSSEQVIYIALKSGLEDQINRPIDTKTAIFTIKDNIKPIVTFDPPNGSVKIPGNRDITITFNERMRKIDDSEITNANVASLVKLKGNNASGADFNFSATINDAKTVITIDPLFDFSANSVVYVGIDAVVEDDADNAIDETSAIFITDIPDVIGPQVVNVTSTNEDKTYTTGDNITVTIEFDEVAVVEGSGNLQLELQTRDPFSATYHSAATYSKGSGTSILEFLYKVGSNGENSTDLSYRSNTALEITGASLTIKDRVGNNANLSLPNPGSQGSLSFNKNIVIDTKGPQVVSVGSSTENGSYRNGAIIKIVVDFDENVYVLGSPSILLETGSSKGNAIYSSGSATSTLVFDYTVQTEHNTNDLDYAGNNALKLNGGSIKDIVAIDANLILPITNTLRDMKDIRIDNIPPQITQSSIVDNGNIPVLNNSKIIYTVSEKVQSADLNMTSSLGDIVNGTLSVVNGNQSSSVDLDLLAPFTSGDAIQVTIENLTDLAGNVSQDIEFEYNVSLIADYNTDGFIDAADLTTLVQGWTNKDLSYELGPTTGEVPNLKPALDGKFDIMDAAVLIRMWHWNLNNNSQSIPRYATMGNPIQYQNNDNSFSINILENTNAIDLYIDYPNDKVQISILDQLSNNNNILLSHLDSLNGMFQMAAGFMDEVDKDLDFNYQIHGREDVTINVVYRYFDNNGNVLSKGTEEILLRAVPQEFALHNNYPNPFNPTTTMRFDLPIQTDAKVIIFNMLGQKVKTFDLKGVSAGYHSVKWNARNDFGDPVGAGVYFYQLQTNNFTKTKKMVLLK